MIELLVTLVLLMTVLTAITASLASGTKSEVNVTKRLQNQSDARQTLTKMREDLHCAYAVQSIGPNADGGFSIALTEFYNTCGAVAQSSSGSSQVYVQWCTIPVAGKPGVFALYRQNSTCSSSGTLMTTGIVAPSGGWPSNSAVTSTPASWAGNIWPTSLITCATSSQNGYLQTQAVDIAVNVASTSASTTNSKYELKDQISLRNATRCGSTGTTGTTASPTLSITAPGAGTAGTTVAGSSITATLASGTSPTGQITFTVFGPQASAPSACASGGTTVGTATVSGNAAYNSSAGWTPSSAGTYWWYASYSGDSGNNSATSTCGSGMTSTVVSVAKANTTLSVAGPTTGTTGVAIAPAAITATLASGSSPGGTITYSVYGPSASAPASPCGSGAGWTTVGSVTASGNGNYSPSAGLNSPAAGTYYWYAAYSGDSANNASNSPCGSGMSQTVVASGPSLTALQMNDNDHDGKVDQVVATFSSTLAACSGSCSTAGWTLANVPSAGTLSAVSVATNKATLTITEGPNPADTSAGTFTVAMSSAANIKDTSNRLASFSAQVPTDLAAPVITNIQSFQTGGVVAGNGTAETGDRLVVTFSEAIVGTTANPTVTETRPNGASGHATLTITGLTTTADTGSSGYLTSKNTTASFTSTSALSGGNKVFTITLGTKSGTGTPAASSGVLALAPSNALKDAAGNICATTYSTANTFKLF